MYFLRNILVESHLVAPALANNMVFSLKLSYFAKFKYILMQPPQKRILGPAKANIAKL